MRFINIKIAPADKIHMWQDTLIDFVAALRMRIQEPTAEEVKRQLPRIDTILRAHPALAESLRAVMNEFELNMWSGWLDKTVDQINPETCRIHQFLLLRLVADGIMQLAQDPLYRPAPKEKPPVSVIIPAWNQWDYTRGTLTSLFAHTVWPEYEVIVVDNGSADETSQGLEKMAKIEHRLRVIRNRRNLGFSGANNQGIEAAAHNHLIFLNNDCLILHSDWIGQMARSFLVHPKIGATGQFGVLDCFEGERVNYYQKVFFDGLSVPVSWISGYNLMITKQALSDAGGWRGDLYGAAGYEDIHLGYALRDAGWMCVSPTEIPLIHHLIGKTRFTENGKAFVAANSPAEDKHKIFCRFFGSRQFRHAA